MKRTFKNIFLVAIVAGLNIGFAACNKDDDNTKEEKQNTTENSVASIIGTWSLQTTNTTDTFVINANTYSYTSDDTKIEGTYTLAGENITFTPTRSWSKKDEQWDEDSEVNTYYGPNGNNKVSVIHNGSVLLLTTIPEDDQIGKKRMADHATTPYLNTEKPLNLNISTLQGQWNCYLITEMDQSLRSRITMRGDTLELVITAWCERYVGKATYENGYITCDSFTFYTTRGPEGGFGPYSETEDPSTWPWRTPANDEFVQPSFESLHFIFIPNGNEAYSSLANLLSIHFKE